MPKPRADVEPALDAVNLGDGVRHLRSREATRYRLAQLVAVTRYTHMTINPEITFDAASLQAAAPLDRILHSRGVQIRVLGVTSGDPDLLCPYGGEPKETLTSSFERHWAAAHHPSEPAMPRFELSPREEAVITLLALGHTDAGVARQLRISERSVSNIVRSIMDRLGVENRFQLGVALGTLRAAPPPPGFPYGRTKPQEKDGDL